MVKIKMKKIPVRQIDAAHKEPASTRRFTIRKVQDLLGGEDLFHDLHRHDFFFMLALPKGNGTHEIDFTTHNIFDNSVFFLRPGQVHQLQPCIGKGNTKFSALKVVPIDAKYGVTYYLHWEKTSAGINLMDQVICIIN